MPPKPGRPRGSTRGRGGGGRGGASTGMSAGEAASSITPQSVEEVAQSAIPKEESADTKPVENPPLEGQQSPSLAASTTETSQDGQDSSARPPVQRLASLNPSRSASPAVRRGTSTRGKRGMVKPTFTGRRSKEERAALEKEALERERERTKEQQAAETRRRRDEERAAKRQADRALRGRGGYTGAMSGPFSLGSSREDRKSSHRGNSGFGSGSRASRVKDEGEASGSGSNYRSGGGGGGPSIKREDGSYETASEDEEDAEFPRKDIDYIEVSSDENEAAPAERHQRTTLPVRIGRKEHQERTIGINTEASAVSANVSGEAAKGTQSSTGASRKQSTHKGKGKASAVEITGVKKPFKGVWQDPEELSSPVKTEQNSEDETMEGVEQVGIVDPADQPAETQDQSLDTERRPKAKVKGIAEPILQTDEDHAEWARFQTNLSHIRAELGPEETPATDTSGDTNMAGAVEAEKKPTVRDNNVYLFQIPPLMPELLLPDVKKEHSEVQTQSVAPAPGPSVKPEVKVKIEEGFSDPAAKGPEGPRFASGCVGKLRVRQSGRTTLDWGGISYELTPGNKPSFLQEVVSIQVVPMKERVVPEDAGDAVSFGRVKGKFVVAPDWNDMLG